GGVALDHGVEGVGGLQAAGGVAEAGARTAAERMSQEPGELWPLVAARIHADRGWLLRPLARLGRPRADRRTWLAEGEPGAVVVKVSANPFARPSGQPGRPRRSRSCARGALRGRSSCRRGRWRSAGSAAS